ncbi:MAG TPA: hypothetical protein DD405_03855 [Desulfobacteraceae bacterium]|nr:hypothetical protein [Desulfobacteraceae bacterium]
MKFLLPAFFILFMVSLSIWGTSHRKKSQIPGCALDGSAITPLYEVIIIPQDKIPKKFAGITNALIWFNENAKQAFSIMVTDEASGKKIKTKDAFYVLSNAITSAYTGNRIHVFTEKKKALSHALQFKGKLVKNPFLIREKKEEFLVKHKADHKNGYGFIFKGYKNILSLSSKIALMYRQSSQFHISKYPTLIFKGYFNLPDKPPMVLI